MKSFNPALVAFTLSASLALTACGKDETWTPLLDKDLSKWNTYLGTPNPETEVADLPKDEAGNYTQPIGHGKDEKGVFTVSEIDGELVLRVSGEIYGSVYTLEDYENYHLSVQFKWGTMKWNPRKDLELDTGILYHGIGEHGVDYWKAWAMSQELQIMEQSNGDWWTIAGSQIDIRCEKPEGEELPHYDIKAKSVSFGPGGAGITCRRSHDMEKPMGEWNTAELITYGDKSLHIVNGEVVMALTNSRYTKDDQVIPLTKGKILLQSEAGEAFFKDIKIKPITGIPSQYQAHFE
jgi:hypothetical protein